MSSISAGGLITAQRSGTLMVQTINEGTEHRSTEGGAGRRRTAGRQLRCAPGGKTVVSDADGRFIVIHDRRRCRSAS